MNYVGTYYPGCILFDVMLNPLYKNTLLDNAVVIYPLCSVSYADQWLTRK